jgi:hypothetical protein
MKTKRDFFKTSIFKATLMLLISLSSFSAFAQATDLVVFSEQGERFWLVVNGIRQNDKAGQNVKVTSLNGDNWQLKIVFENENLPDIDQSLYFTEKNKELTARIRKNKKGVLKLQMFGVIPISNDNQTTTEQEIIPFHTIETKDDDYNIRVKIKVPGFETEVQVDEPLWEEENQPRTRTERNRNDSQRQNCQYPMQSSDFNKLKEVIDNQSFDEERVNIAKQALRSKCVSTSQVIEILNLITFEESRLDFAKFVYDYTTDIGNYYQINESFTFDSTKSEFNSFLENKQ